MTSQFIELDYKISDASHIIPVPLQSNAFRAGSALSESYPSELDFDARLAADDEYKSAENPDGVYLKVRMSGIEGQSELPAAALTGLLRIMKIKPIVRDGSEDLTKIAMDYSSVSPDETPKMVASTTT